MLRAKLIGASGGFVFGLAALQFGFWRTLIYLGGCTLIGWIVGRVIEGEISLDEMVDRYTGRERV